jgi:hypothetical protein
MSNGFVEIFVKLLVTNKKTLIVINCKIQNAFYLYAIKCDGCHPERSEGSPVETGFFATLRMTYLELFDNAWPVPVILIPEAYMIELC